MDPTHQHRYQGEGYGDHDQALNALIGEFNAGGTGSEDGARARASMGPMGGSGSSIPTGLYQHPSVAGAGSAHGSTATTMGSYNYLLGNPASGMEFSPYGLPAVANAGMYYQTNPQLGAMVMSKHSSAPMGSAGGGSSASGREDSSMQQQQHQLQQQQFSQWMATAAAMGIPSHLLLQQQQQMLQTQQHQHQQQQGLRAPVSPVPSSNTRHGSTASPFHPGAAANMNASPNPQTVHNTNTSLSIATSLLMDHASEGSTTISHHTNASSLSLGGFTGANRSNASLGGGGATNMSAVASAGSTGMSGGPLGAASTLPGGLYAHPYAAANAMPMAMGSNNIVARAGEMAAMMTQSPPNPSNVHPMMYGQPQAQPHPQAQQQAPQATMLLQQHPAFLQSQQRQQVGAVQQAYLPDGTNGGHLFLHPQQARGHLPNPTAQVPSTALAQQPFYTTMPQQQQQQQQQLMYQQPVQPFFQQPQQGMPIAGQGYQPTRPMVQQPHQFVGGMFTAGQIPLGAASPSFLHPGVKTLSSAAGAPKPDKITASTIPLDEEAARERKKHLQAKRKTAFCHFYPDNVHLCPFGDQCAFAHNKDERSTAKDKWGSAMDKTEDKKQRAKLQQE